MKTMLLRSTTRTIVLILLVCVCVSGKTPKLNITLKTFSDREQKKKSQLIRLADEYDLTRYTITRDIVIEEGAVNHSSPVLTLNPMFLDNDDRALSVYVHEQGHWVMMTRHHAPTRDMIVELRRLYPNINIQPPYGDGNPGTSYGHLVVIMLEWQALEELIGVRRARAVLEYKRQERYRDLFGTVMDHRSQMEEFLKRYDLKW
jgi:hypothetical protein